MRNVDLSSFSIRTDLIIDLEKDLLNFKNSDFYNKNNINVSSIYLDKDEAEKYHKNEGRYVTISFDDITDNTNFLNVRKIVVTELKKLIDYLGIKDDDSCFVVGLGNVKITPDAIGPKVIDNIISTRHIYELTSSLEDGYRIVSKMSPGVMGDSGIETIDVINSLINFVRPDFLIVIDALASSSITRLGKTIQISTGGICPGSGVSNKRKEISFATTGINVISIGVPLVVMSSVICYDTMNFMLKQFSFNVNNKNDLNKLIPFSWQNYLEYDIKGLSNEEKKFFLGEYGLLSECDKLNLIRDVLLPTGYDYTVTSKDIDFLVDKFSELISFCINNSLHNIKTDKNY